MQIEKNEKGEYALIATKVKVEQFERRRDFALSLLDLLVPKNILEIGHYGMCTVGIPRNFDTNGFEFVVIELIDTRDETIDAKKNHGIRSSSDDLIIKVRANGLPPELKSQLPQIVGLGDTYIYL